MVQRVIPVRAARCPWRLPACGPRLVRRSAARHAPVQKPAGEPSRDRRNVLWPPCRDGSSSHVRWIRRCRCAVPCLAYPRKRPGYPRIILCHPQRACQGMPTCAVRSRACRGQSMGPFLSVYSCFSNLRKLFKALSPPCPSARGARRIHVGKGRHVALALAGGDIYRHFSDGGDAVMGEGVRT